jgi:type III restriction enzyme
LAGEQEKPILAIFRFKEVTEIKCGPASEQGHIYCSADGGFRPTKKLNNWEQNILSEEQKKPEFIGWFRNPETGEDRVAIPYRDGAGTWRTKSPDFIVFHRDGKNIVCGLVEPHDIASDNSWCIAKGMADFAALHKEFARIELTIEDGKKIKRIDLTKPSWRKRVQTIGSNDALKALFVEIG